MLFKLETKDNFILEGGKKIWLVKSGEVNVYRTRLLSDGSYGRKEWLFSVEKGCMMAGFDYRSGGRFKITASALPEAELEEKNLDFLYENNDDPVMADFHAALVDGWAKNLTFALLGYKLPPNNLEFLYASENLKLSSGSCYGARTGEVLWIKLIEGEIDILSSYAAFFKGHSGYFPVTDRFWFKINSSGFDSGPVVELAGDSALSEGDPASAGQPVVTALDTRQFLSLTKERSSFDAFHSIFLWLLIEKHENESAEEYARLLKKCSRDAAIVDNSFALFASIIDSEFDETARKYDATDGLAAACMMIGDAAGIKMKIPPAATDNELSVSDFIERIACVSMVRYRKVLLRDDWWNKDAGPLLVFCEDGRPAALIPSSFKGYKLYLPGSARPVAVDAKKAAMVSGFAYMFYRPLPMRSLTIADIGSYVLGAGVFRDSIMMAFAGIVIGIINMLLPMASGIAFDSLIPEIERSQMLQMTLILISASVCLFLFQLFRSVAVMRFENKLDASLQAAVWDRLIALPAPFFRKFSTGDLAMRAMSVNTVRQTISTTIFSSLLTGSFSVLNFLLLFYYNMKLAFVAVALTMLAVFFYTSVLIIQYNYSKKIIKLEGKLSGLVFSIITAIAKFRVAGAEKRAFGLWASLFKEKKGVRVYILNNLTAVFNSVYISVCTGVFFWCIINYPGENSVMSSGTFVAFNSAFTAFFSSIIEISTSMMSFLNVFILYDRARPILEAVPEFDAGGEDPGELNGAVEISGVTFKYEGGLINILNDISLSIKPGEFAAIVGPSGSGKSTLMRLLLGFDRPVSGSIFYDGCDLRAIDIRAVRRQIGAVLQNSQLMAGTILSNIIGSSMLTIDDAWEAAERAGLAGDIKMMPMQMHTVISEGASCISGGQKQRILIARALVKKPRIILFDEATSALENKTQAVVSESLEKLRATRIVVAHRLSTIIKADKIYVIDGGRLIESGTYDELMKYGGEFKKLAERQII